MKKKYILDTSVYLTDPKSLYCYIDGDIILPLKVLEELDKHKSRQDSIGLNARNVIRTLDVLRESGSLDKGVKLHPNKHCKIITKQIDYSILKVIVPLELDVTDADNQIIATALMEKRDGHNVTVVSRDINMRVKCDALGLKSVDYEKEKVVKDSEELYLGASDHVVADKDIDSLYKGSEVFLSEKNIKLHANQYVMLTSDINPKKTILTKFSSYNKPLHRLEDYKDGEVWGLTPRNREQIYAVNLLMDANIPVATLVGRSGSGKTCLAIAAGLQQVLEGGGTMPHAKRNGKNKKHSSSLLNEPTGRYKRLIVSRPVQPLGKDIGFLPGDLNEKMKPWLMPIEDNLKFLMGNDRLTLDMYIENGIIELEALTYIRGRSISNAYIIIDEAQNLTAHELKTILTRIGEGSKIVLTGDIEQIDNVYLNASTNGLTCAVEKFKDQELFGHVTLVKGERSEVATIASYIL